MAGAKQLVLGLGRTAGLFALARGLTRHRLRILSYHGVEACASRVLNYDGLQLHPDLFRAHLEILRDRYRVVRLADMVEDLVAGRKPEPCTVAITFDDGYQNNLSVAAPMLQAFGFPATVFVTTGFIDGRHAPWWYGLRAALAACDGLLPMPDGAGRQLATDEDRVEAAVAWERYLPSLDSAVRAERVAALEAVTGPWPAASPFPFLDPEGVRALGAMGIDVEPHTVSHISLAEEEGARLRRELDESMETVTAWTGNACRVYAYPHGRIAAAGIDHLKAKGVRGGVTTVSGLNRLADDPFLLRRWTLNEGHDALAFAGLTSGFTDLLRAIMGRA